MLGNLADDTREQWLNAFAIASRSAFERAGYPLPNNVRISIGFPSTGTRGKRIGECWGEASSADSHFEIFIRPSQHGSARIADILTHELVHAAVGLDAGHGKAFKRCATALELIGKMTATVAGPDWYIWAQPILDQLGPMPHAQLREMTSARKKQTTRMVKVECPSCGYIYRTSARWLIEGIQCPIETCRNYLTWEG